VEALSDPLFVVIAGPNGAGKSTTSSEFVDRLGIGEPAFDWDDRFNAAWARFGYDPVVSAGIRNSVNEEFQKFIDDALTCNSAQIT
jgi:adenylate kinase family enzyme